MDFTPLIEKKRERLAELEKAYGNLSPTTLQAMQIDALKEIARSGKATIIVDGSGHGVTLTQPAN